MKLGFIGTGTITQAVIVGLQNADNTNQIVISPRSEAISTALADRYPNVTRAPSNLAVAENADIVFFGMRPTQLETALEGVNFRNDQLVVSFVSGLSIDELQAIAPEARVCRVLPLPMIARGEGPVICYPAFPEITTLLTGLGEMIRASDEAQLKTLGTVSAFMSSYFQLQLTITGALAADGVPADLASLYVRSLFSALGQTGINTPTGAETALPGEHETKGGLNETVRKYLDGAGWFNEPQKIFSKLNSLTRADLE